MAVNHASLATWFSDVAIQFVSLGIGGLDVRCADQRETVKLLTDGTAVAAISAEGTPPVGCDCTALGILEYVAVASPLYASEQGQGTGRGASLLLFDKADVHTLEIGELIQRNINIDQQHYLPDWCALLAASLAGAGYAVMPRALVQDLLGSGRLVTVIESSELFVPLYLHYWRLKGTKLDGLIRTIKNVAIQQLARSAP